jgi:o-succinylbenzoate---CoA ligase
MKPLRLVPANDTFRALGLMADVLDNKTAGFITSPEVNGLMPEVHGLSDQVEDSVGLIVESSGSTGVPKRIELSSAALLASAEASAKRIGSGQWLLALPVNFIGGANVLIRSVVADTQPVIMNTRLPFTAEAFVRGAALMTETRYTSLVPAQLAKLAQAAETDAFVFSELRKFETILLGGQRPDWAVVESLRSKGVNIVISYGMTETAGGCVYDGVPLDGVQLSFADSRIAIAGPVLANNLQSPYLTQDLGELVDGKLEVLGRADRVIVSGGLKVSLDRVEEAALQLPGVEEVIAQAITTSWGQSVGILYVGSPEVEFSALSDITIAARPAKVIRVNALPRLSSGKPDLQAAAGLLAS